MSAAPKFCCACKRTEEERELRPYGKDGKPICMPCAQSTPERQREMRKRLKARVGAAGETLILTPDGPVGVDAFAKASGSGQYRPGQTVASVAAVGQPSGGHALVASCANPIDLGIATVVMCRTLLSFPQVFNEQIRVAATALVAALRGDNEGVEPLQVVDQTSRDRS